jgi:hypothetical protein
MTYDESRETFRFVGETSACFGSVLASSETSRPVAGLGRIGRLDEAPGQLQ